MVKQELLFKDINSGHQLHQFAGGGERLIVMLLS